MLVDLNERGGWGGEGGERYHEGDTRKKMSIFCPHTWKTQRISPRNTWFTYTKDWIEINYAMWIFKIMQGHDCMMKIHTVFYKSRLDMDMEILTD